MTVKIGQLSCVATSLSSPLQQRKKLICLSRGLFDRLRLDSYQQTPTKVVKTCGFMYGIPKIKSNCRERYKPPAAFDDSFLDSDLEPDALEPDLDEPLSEHISIPDSLYVYAEGFGGRPGFISFYNRPYRSDGESTRPVPKRKQSELLWFVGPAVLVVSFVFPSLYLRKILSAVFEDSLLTDFLILFFTEFLFYCGVAVFLLVVDHLRRPIVPVLGVPHENPSPKLGQRISSVAVLVLSLIIPLVTMGFVWPWTGPAASATLAPYLVGIVVQFAFEQYAKRIKSPSLPVVPVIFQVYRLHQLNRAAQLVTALSFTVRGVEMTPHNLAINSSLGTLLNVLQFLGVICIWSLSSFLMRFTPSVSATAEQ